MGVPLIVEQAADKICVRKGHLVVLPVTTSSVTFDILGDTTHDGLGGLLPAAAGRIVAHISDVDLGYLWVDSPGDEIDLTMTFNGAFPERQCFEVSAGFMDEFVPIARYLAIQGTANGLFRLAITSGRTRLSGQSGT